MYAVLFGPWDPFGIDESNLKDDYTRNQIRHSLVDTLSEDQKEEWLHTIEKENREWNTKIVSTEQGEVAQEI